MMRRAFVSALLSQSVRYPCISPALEPDIDLGVFRADHATTACQRWIFDNRPCALVRRLRKPLTYRGGVLGVEVNSNIARGCGELRQTLPDDSDHLRGIDPHLPPCKL